MDASKEAKVHNLLYAASPYSLYDSLHSAWRDISIVSSKLIKRGYRVYAPISYTHAICLHGALDPLDHPFWMDFNESMMNVSDALLIVMLDGWKRSKGINMEIEFFEGAKRPIYCVNPHTLKIVRYK